MIVSLLIATALVYIAYKLGYRHGSQDTVHEVMEIMRKVKEGLDK